MSHISRLLERASPPVRRYPAGEDLKLEVLLI